MDKLGLPRYRGSTSRSPGLADSKGPAMYGLGSPQMPPPVDDDEEEDSRISRNSERRRRRFRKQKSASPDKQLSTGTEGDGVNLSLIHI